MDYSYNLHTTSRVLLHLEILANHLCRRIWYIHEWFCHPIQELASINGTLLVDQKCRSWDMGCHVNLNAGHGMCGLLCEPECRWWDMEYYVKPNAGEVIWNVMWTRMQVMRCEMSCESKCRLQVMGYHVNSNAGYVCET